MFDLGLHIPPRTGLSRLQRLHLRHLLAALRARYGFMCDELRFAAEEAVRYHGNHAARYVAWIFACEWDCSIEEWRGFLIQNPEALWTQ